jgi:hypothetical protein
MRSRLEDLETISLRCVASGEGFIEVTLTVEDSPQVAFRSGLQVTPVTDTGVDQRVKHVRGIARSAHNSCCLITV